MKRLVLVLTLMTFSTAAFATEPLLLEPLSPAVLSGPNVTSSTTATTTDSNGVQVTLPNGEATFVPASSLGENMVPQNAAAEGKPVPAKEEPRVKIQTKQRSQGNSYWNAGGKGTKSFF
jgi:hypothetical protein